MKIIGNHPSGAKAEITPNASGSGTFDLICTCPDGYVTHGDWYMSIAESKKVARVKSFTVSDMMCGKHEGRWKWKIEKE